MYAARSLRHQRGYVIFVVAAMLALLQPLFTPLAPQLAGWLPGHQHVYVNGVAVNHAHPWDDLSEVGGAAVDPPSAGYIFHLCDIHPDGLVPVTPSSSMPESSPAVGDAETDAAEVVFTFDLGVSAVALPGLIADFTPCRGELVFAPERAASPVAAPGEHPIPPPPRA